MRSASFEEDLVQCPVCDVYLKKSEGFTCTGCKRGILCKKHSVAGLKECSSCVFDRKTRELSVLREQERNLRGVLRLFQFFFLVFSVFFIAIRFGLNDVVEILQNSFITEGLIYMGIASACGYVAFYLILNSQKNKTEELSADIRKLDFMK